MATNRKTRLTGLFILLAAFCLVGGGIQAQDEKTKPDTPPEKKDKKDDKTEKKDEKKDKKDEKKDEAKKGLPRPTSVAFASGFKGRRDYLVTYPDKTEVKEADLKAPQELVKKAVQYHGPTGDNKIISQKAGWRLSMGVDLAKIDRKNNGYFQQLKLVSSEAEKTVYELSFGARGLKDPYVEMVADAAVEYEKAWRPDATLEKKLEDKAKDDKGVVKTLTITVKKVEEEKKD